MTDLPEDSLQALVEEARKAKEWRVLDPKTIASLINRLASALERSLEDSARMDWLATKTVNVRSPLVHGSRDMFWASPGNHEDEHADDCPSDIRARIDSFLP